MKMIVDIRIIIMITANCQSSLRSKDGRTFAPTSEADCGLIDVDLYDRIPVTHHIIIMDGMIFKL
jgi:hypothetical protein